MPQGDVIWYCSSPVTSAHCITDRQMGFFLPNSKSFLEFCRLSICCWTHRRKHSSEGRGRNRNIRLHKGDSGLLSSSSNNTDEEDARHFHSKRGISTAKERLKPEAVTLSTRQAQS